MRHLFFFFGSRFHGRACSFFRRPFCGDADDYDYDADDYDYDADVEGRRNDRHHDDHVHDDGLRRRAPYDASSIFHTCCSLRHIVSANGFCHRILKASWFGISYDERLRTRSQSSSWSEFIEITAISLFLCLTPPIHFPIQTHGII